MLVVIETLRDLESQSETLFTDVPRWQIVAGVAGTTLVTIWAKNIFRDRKEVVASLKSQTFQLLKIIPAVQRTIDKEMAKAKADMASHFYRPEDAAICAYDSLPQNSKTKEEVLELTKQLLESSSFEWKEGKISGGVFAGKDESYTQLMEKIFNISVWTNPLHFDVFPGVRKMEAEVVQMTTHIMNGDKNTVGCMTSGGTESLLAMMKAYRDWARETKGIRNPEVVAAYTVHAAINKGAHIMGYKLRLVNVDPVTWKADMKAIKAEINSNTILLVASAPEFAHGIVDDVEAMGKLAVKHNIGLHVDSCLGGYILPFMSEAGYPIKPFDFRVPGVTSISADTHKYGNAPKGSSVILYSNQEFLHYQYFVCPDWPGGIYATPTIPGSRVGAHVAMCWAALMSHGRKGYVDKTRKIIKTARYLRKEFSRIPGIFVYGEPEGPVVSIGSHQVNILNVADVTSEFGWHLQPLQKPPGMHIFLTALHTSPGVKEKLVKVVREAVESVRMKGSDMKGFGAAKMYGMMASVPDTSILKDVINTYFDMAYSTEEELKEAKRGGEDGGKKG